MATTPLRPPIEHPISFKANQIVTEPWALFFQGIISGSGINAPSFGIISVSNWDDVEATIPTDTLTLVAGTNVSLETNALGKSVTINATGGQPAPPNKSVQFNDLDEFGGNAAFLFDKDTISASLGLEHDFGTTGSSNLMVGTGHTIV